MIFERQGSLIFTDQGEEWELLHIEGDYQIWYRNWRKNVPTTYRIVKTDFNEAVIIKDIRNNKNRKVRSMVKEIIEGIQNAIY